MIGDRRERSYTHIGLVEQRPRSGSNTDRARSYSLIESMNNMTVAAPTASKVIPASAVPPGIVESARVRSQSQGSADLNSSTNNLVEHRESSPVRDFVRFSGTLS